MDPEDLMFEVTFNLNKYRFYFTISKKNVKGIAA